MIVECKYCAHPFETEWWPPVDSDNPDDPQVRFRRSLCDQCEVFAWVEATSKHWIISLPKKYSGHDYTSQFNNRYDWSKLRPNWYYQGLQYQKWGVAI